jgi:hypothetical protein
MEAHHHAHAAFHLTGRLADEHLTAIEGHGLVPALFSGYRDLTELRYDYPLVLVEAPIEGRFVESLSGVMDEVLAHVAGGSNEDRIRMHVLRLESGVRALVATGATIMLSEAWETVAKELATIDDGIADSLAYARMFLAVDGMLVDCGQSTASQVLTHAWNVAYAGRAASFADTMARLTVGLVEILEADFENSAEARSAENLKASFGSGPMDQFDFDAMSRILTDARPPMTLPGSRRHRIEQLVEVLRSQQFYADPATGGAAPYSFVFHHCVDALAAFRDRLTAAVEVTKALAVGSLEVSGLYDEAKHDQLFASFGETGLDPSDLALFPDYLVLLNVADMTAEELEQLSQVLSSGLPFKVLVQTDDVIEPAAIGEGISALALASHRLTSMAMGLGDVYVLQTTSSHVLRVRDEVTGSLAHHGPALISVFSGTGAEAPGIPPYLVSSAALEARVFPQFVYDPSAGADWASRFSVADNPQAEADWPIHEFCYEDAQNQSVCEKVPFTLVDFVSFDRRYVGHFADVPVDAWSPALVNVDAIVGRSSRADVDQLPCLLMAADDGTLHKVIVDESVIREARRCRSMWSSIQELGGIHNSHADRLLAAAEAEWQANMQEQLAAMMPAAVVAVETTEIVDGRAEAEPSPAEADSAPESTRNPDEPYIETPRCSTCNECTQINGKMFAYNENQQAYIADLKAGTYAQLVEAAESCQVSVIHPGKPWDANEPGLEDLLKRAEVFI